jgi:hypothetical protein
VKGVLATKTLWRAQVMRKANLAILFVAVVLLGATGCQKLHFTKTLKLGPGNVEDFHFDPPAYNQRVTVTIEPTGGGVSAYLVKEADWEAAARNLRKNAEPDAGILLGSRVSRGPAETYTFEATVPAKTEYALLVKAGSQMADVKITVVGR